VALPDEVGQTIPLSFKLTLNSVPAKWFFGTGPCGLMPRVNFARGGFERERGVGNQWQKPKVNCMVALLKMAAKALCRQRLPVNAR